MTFIMTFVMTFVMVFIMTFIITCIMTFIMTFFTTLVVAFAMMGIMTRWGEDGDIPPCCDEANRRDKGGTNNKNKINNN